MHNRSSPTTLWPRPTAGPRPSCSGRWPSISIRSALERHFGVTIAFQNCHRAAVFAPGAPPAANERFVSPEARVPSQKPELVNC
ncbi:MAG TPA: hypothetical protein VH373_13825 [Jatrophihabitantaceae bacterium]